MQQDMADARALKVAQTPDFYVNGKHLKPFGAKELRALVASEVKAVYP
jgi:protein-disulfide isomerase